jgi:threonine dehydrogenase-like Zn-dependent dehydrogenase
VRTTRFDVSVAKILVTRGLRRIWPGIIWSPLSPTRFVDLPDPALPGPRWIRASNRQCGICATDLALLLVRGGPRISVAALPGFSSFYLGHELVADVTEVGPGVTRLGVGDRVVLDTTIFGPNCLSQEIDPPCTYCAAGDYSLCQCQSAQAGPARIGGGWGDSFIAHESEVYRVPNSLTDDQAVLLEPAGGALRTVMSNPPQPGESVLVVGCGVLGLLVCAVARLVQPSAQITAIARYPHQATMARRLGADNVLSDKNLFSTIADLTSARLYEGRLGNRTLMGGFDTVYDTIGSGRTIGDSLRWTRARGTVVVVGIAFDFVRTDLTPLWHQEVTLKGVTGHEVDDWDGSHRKGYDLLVQWIEEGRLATRGFITHRYPFQEYKRAVASALDKRTGAIKVVLQMES